MLPKIEHYISALAQLEQAAAIYQKSQQDALYRDGLIQRFEFTVDLAWQSIKEYLEDQGCSAPIATPRAVLKEAFAAGVIQDADAWNSVITARNITSHVYDEKTAENVATQICSDFLPLMKELRKFFGFPDVFNSRCIEKSKAEKSKAMSASKSSEPKASMASKFFSILPGIIYAIGKLLLDVFLFIIYFLWSLIK